MDQRGEMTPPKEYEAARRLLGLSGAEIESAMRTGPDALDILHALALEIQRTMRPQVVGDWIDRPVPAFSGLTPRQMITSGQARYVLQSLRSFNEAGFAG